MTLAICSRRMFLASMTATLVAGGACPKLGAAAMTETYANVALPDDIARQWPDGRTAPQLILDVARYMADKPWLSLGATRLVGDRMDDHWIGNGADLWRDFGIFMRLPEGSRVAQWFRDGDTGEPPIVLIGSEGEQRILAPDLHSFLAAWALADAADQSTQKMMADVAAKGTPIELPSDLLRDDDDEDFEGNKIPDGRPEFARFLEGKIGQPLASLLKPSPDSAPFVSFFSAWGERADAELAANSNLKKIAEALDQYVPRGKNIWERTSFKLAAAGDRLEIGSANDPRKVLSETEAAAVRPLILAERKRRAEGVHAVRGLWHSAFVFLYPDGSCQIPADWSSEPKFFHGPLATKAEFDAEFANYPKSPRWIEPWMTAER